MEGGHWLVSLEYLGFQAGVREDYVDLTITGQFGRWKGGSSHSNEAEQQKGLQGQHLEGHERRAGTSRKQS